MGYRKFRDAHHRKRDCPPHGYYAAHDDDRGIDQADGQLTARDELSRLTGCSGATIHRFAEQGIIPVAGRDRDGKWLFDTDDERLAEWIAALRGAGYHRPAGAA